MRLKMGYERRTALVEKLIKISRTLQQGGKGIKAIDDDPVRGCLRIEFTNENALKAFFRAAATEERQDRIRRENRR